MSDETETPESLVEVGRYSSLAAARERALVVSARDLPHWVNREGDEWVLRVEPPAHEEVARELALFESEQRERPPAEASEPERPVETLSLYVFAWLMGTFFFLQNVADPARVERGVAVSRAMVGHGEWWRALTALTLHADMPHVVANLATGLVFAAFLLPQLGTGATWLLVVVSGALGNAINAWGHRGESHSSIGASTAVFGALGILVGLDFIARFSSRATRKRWQLVLPVGAGLALLAYLGVGDQHDNIDYMAHFWGFATGTLIGVLAGPLRLGERLPRWWQHTASLTAVALIAFAWRLALR